MTRLSFIPQQFIKVAIAARSDLSQIVVGGIHIAPGSSAGVVRQWKVNVPAMTDGGEIVFANAADKDDSVDYEIDDDGSLLITWAQAAPGGGGATSQPEIVRIPNVFPPAPPAPSGDGGGMTFVAPAAGYVRLHEGPFDGQQALDLSSFGIPPSALLNLKVTVNAATIGARGRVGPHSGSSGAAMLATVVMAANVRNYAFMMSAPGANNTLVLWADAGALSEFYVDVLGWWY